MGQDDIARGIIRASVLALLFSPGCKLEDQLTPTGPTGASDVSDGVAGTVGSNSTGTGGTGNTGSSQLTAPIISDPLSGSTVQVAQPALTILNSARSLKGTPTYLFQVSSDPDFSLLVAQSAQIAENPDGSTAWIVDRPLEQGTHYWRVRARIGTVDSAFSATAELTISATATADTTGSTPSPTPDTPTPGTIVADPLLGGSIGEVSGGVFTNDGWQVRSPADYIRYEIPPMSSGYVSFETTGLRPVNSSPDQFMLFGMWDPSAGDYRANRFRVHLQKLHPDPHNPPYLRVRWIANGEQHDEGSNFLSWNPSRAYHWRIEWGPSGGAHRAVVYLDGSPEITVNYRRAYSPNVHFVELGIAERGESVVGTIYRNLRIGN